MNDDYENIPQAPSMSNKRKPKFMDFSFPNKNSVKESIPEKKELKIQEKAKVIKEMIELKEKPEIKKEEMIKTDKKPKKTFGKFNLKLKDDIIEESSKENFLEIDKSEKIPIKAIPQINIINEEKFGEINKPKSSNLKNPLKFKKNIGSVLSIDTDQINEIYSCGGEKGKRVNINLDELSEEYREISELAVLCVRYMSIFYIFFEENFTNSHVLRGGIKK